MSNVSIAKLLNGFEASIKVPVLFLFGWNIFRFGFSLYSFLHMLFLLLAAAALYAAIKKSGTMRNGKRLVGLFFCLLAFLPCISLWHFVSDEISYIYPRMLVSVALVLILALTLSERYGGALLKKAIILLTAVIVFHYGVLANISYYYMNECQVRTYADGIEMAGRIHEMDDGEDLKYIAVLGENIRITGLYDKPVTGKIFGNSYNQLALDESILDTQKHITACTEHMFGIDLKPLEKDQCDALMEKEEVKEMGVWPKKDSMLIMGDTLVIKLAEDENCEGKK